MKKTNNLLRSDFVWNAIGVTINSFNSLFFLLAVRYINGVDEAGIFTYAFAVASLFYTVAIFYNRTFQVADKSEKYTLSDYLSLRGVMSGLSLMLVGALCVVSGFSLHKSIVVLGLMGFRVAEAISDAFYGELQKNGKLYISGISLTLKGILGLLVFIVLDKISGNVILALGGLILINLIILYIYDIRSTMRVKKQTLKLSRKNLRKLASEGFFVFLFSALGIYLANCQKYILTYFVSDEAQAIFGIIVMPATVMSLMGSYLINPFAAKLTELSVNGKMKEFQEEARKILTVLLSVGMLAIVVCYFIGIPVLNLLYNMEFGEYKLDLMIIVAASALTAGVGIISALLTILGENKKQSLAYGISAGLSTVLSLIFIINFGLDGGTWAYGVSAAVLMAAYIILYRKKVKAKITS